MKKFTLLFFTFIFLLSVNIKSQWVLMSNGIPAGSLTTMGSLGDYVFVGTSPYGVMFSSNNGNNWTQNSFNDKSIRCFATQGTTIYTGTSTFGVYKSTNNCVTWIQTSLNNKDVYSLAVNGNNIYAGTQENGVWLSTNSGSNWTQTGFTDKFILSLAAFGNYVIAGTFANGLYVSSNNGATWTQTITGDKTIRSIIVNGGYLFAAVQSYPSGNGGVYFSVNNGANWTQSSFSYNGHCLFLNGTQLFAGTQGYGVFLSVNNASSWVNISEGYPGGTTLAFAATSNYLFLADLPLGVYRRPFSQIGISNISTEIPAKYSLSQNYPNPFNPSTKIKFDTPPQPSPKGREQWVRLVIYDILGKEVTVLVNQQLQPGSYEVEWNASNYPSGVYYYKIAADDYSETKKMVLLK